MKKTTDKVQVGESTTGTSTSTTYTINSKTPTEYGWVCPRCNRVNAPWKSQCDCSGNNWYPTWYYYDYKEPWWKQVTCNQDTFKVHPETTTWKAPSTYCESNSSTTQSDNITAYNVKVDGNTYSANTNFDVGGSDYWNSVTKNWENVPKTYTNQVDDMINRIDHVTTTTYYNTGDTK